MLWEHEIILSYKGENKKLYIRNDYYEILNAFIDAFNEDKNKEFLFSYFNGENKKIYIDKNISNSEYFYMIDKIYCIEKEEEEKSKNKILSKLSDKFYSYECTNNSELSAYINEGTMEANIKINIKNNGTLDWPQNKTKLIFENNSDIRGNEIKLKGQKCGEEYKYEVKFKNLQNLKVGEYI